MKKILFILSVLFLFTACTQKNTETNNETKYLKQAEKLGFEKGKTVLLLHADDAGMCTEANDAIISYLEKGDIKSAAVMAPCPAFDDFIEWAKANPKTDIGMHLTLTSEWQDYRWGPVADSAKVPGLVDPDGKFWHEVPGVVQHANAAEVETEIRAQIDKTIAVGWQPTHIDTHMGTLYGSPDYVKVFIKVAQEYGIPANIIDITNKEVLEAFRKTGYPLTDEVVEMVAGYKLPKLDNFTSVPHGKTYEEVRENFFKLVKSLAPGLTEIIFHPSTETENIKTITNSWQQRVWEAQLFSDPVVKKFFEDEGIVLTNWIDIMDRFNKAAK
jgi:predicted glycoside hydrolase/deacetylase ChbG (UPF0249 family)